jgi:hypothetical protein
MPSIGMVGFMVGDDIHLVMWESVGDVLIAGIGRGASVVMLARVVLCHTNRDLFCLCHYYLLMHTCSYLAKNVSCPHCWLFLATSLKTSFRCIKVLGMMKEEQHKRKL